MRGISRSMHAYIVWQDMRVGLTAEDVSWSPDVALDMTNRLHGMWHTALLELDRFGMLDNSSDDNDDDEYGPTPDYELQDPRIVRLEDRSEDG